MNTEPIKENEIQETCDMIVRSCKYSDFAEFYEVCSINFNSALKERSHKISDTLSEIFFYGK